MFTVGPALLERFPSAYRVAQELEKYKLNVMRAFEIDFPDGVTMDGVVGAADEEGTPEWSSPFGAYLDSELLSVYVAYHRKQYVCIYVINFIGPLLIRTIRCWG